MTTTASAPPVQATLDRAVDHLLSLQSPEGWWKGELETNVTMDAEDLLLRQFLGIRTDEQTEMSATLDPLEAARRRDVGKLLGRARPTCRPRSSRTPR